MSLRGPSSPSTFTQIVRGMRMCTYCTYIASAATSSAGIAGRPLELPPLATRPNERAAARAARPSPDRTWMSAAATSSSEHQAAAIDEQWHELQRSDRWTVSAAVAAAARANPPRSQRHDTRALRWRPHEPHELEAMSAWADLQAAETSLAVAHKVKRGRCQLSQVPDSSSPTHRKTKRNRWAAVVAATELAFGQQCVIST